MLLQALIHPEPHDDCDQILCSHRDVRHYVALIDILPNVFVFNVFYLFIALMQPSRLPVLRFFVKSDEGKKDKNKLY